jgi:ABC-type glycerol-3-phosphate transport system permease component
VQNEQPEGDAMKVLGLIRSLLPAFGWTTVFLYLSLAAGYALARQWKAAALSFSFAVSNWLIFCAR